MVIGLLGEPVWLTAIGAGMALLLGVAGWHKLRDTLGFTAVLQSYDVLAQGLVRPVALLLPWLEIVTAGGLLAFRQPFIVWLAAALLLTYAIAMALSLLQGRRIADCGCQAGARRQAVSWPLVWRNLILMLLTLNLLLPPSGRILVFYDWLVIGCVVLTGSAFYFLANTLIANQNSARELSL